MINFFVFNNDCCSLEVDEALILSDEPTNQPRHIVLVCWRLELRHNALFVCFWEEGEAVCVAFFALC